MKFSLRLSPYIIKVELQTKRYFITKAINSTVFPQGLRSILVHLSYNSVTAWKVSVFNVFLVSIFPHSDWIRVGLRSIRVATSQEFLKTSDEKLFKIHRAIFVTDFSSSIVADLKLKTAFANWKKIISEEDDQTNRSHFLFSIVMFREHLTKLLSVCQQKQRLTSLLAVISKWRQFVGKSWKFLECFSENFLIFLE